ncbi:xanthine/uracil transporter [Klebsormidium nitens]|uniref:Xanthine/uracil transporter n=1 Tax=Klebsormidium nitens TaxID=105231 RepID=A0A1Y1IH58_KLENI|nr:xanthine/uracil transporter [Klebsormidium nitens]|eukprot:GAQ90200.1 xanthine/uracil transporter [Klebsormidium nitens]
MAPSADVEAGAPHSPHKVDTNPTPQVTYKDFKKIIDYKNPKDCIFGNYDYGSMCMPRWPWCTGRFPNLKPTPQRFFPVDEPLPWMLALLMGFQHAVAMIGGIIVPPLLISATQDDPDTKSYLVSASLIVSGICSVIQCLRFKIPYTNLFYGTGMITVTGNGVQQLQVILISLEQMTADGVPWNEAYGKMLGTLFLCSFTMVLISFLPEKAINRIFPPWIAGVTVFVGGVSLVGVGLSNWGGGTGCTDGKTLCKGNGGVELLFGNANYIGLGFIVFASIIIIELFGSPFMRNVQIMAGFLIGYLVAALARHDGQKYTNNAAISAAPAGQFLWLRTFKIGFYPAAVLPLIIAAMVDSSNTVGDITASEEASGLATYGPEHNAHLQGGLLADGINSMFAALATVTPVLVFAQNNGVISFTLVAARVAGTFCGFWLIALGIIGKFGAFLANAPNIILGGLQTFVFSTVAMAGIRLMMMTNFTRRIRFIQVLAIGVGVGATLVPNWGTNDLWPVTPSMSTFVKSLRNSVTIIMGTGFALAFVIAVICHNILPEEEDPAALRLAYKRNAIAYGATNTEEGLTEEVYAKQLAELREEEAEVARMSAPGAHAMAK